MRNGSVYISKKNQKCQTETSIPQIYDQNLHTKVDDNKFTTEDKKLETKSLFSEYIFSSSIPSTTAELDPAYFLKKRIEKRRRYFSLAYLKNFDKNYKESAHEYLCQLPARTTFHGVRDCYYAKSGLRRLIWFLTISVAIFAALQGCYLIVQEFVKRPVTVSYLIVEADRKGLLLPDIIICPFNRFNRSYLTTLNVSDGLAQYLELSFPSPVLHLFQLKKYKSTVRRLDAYAAELNELLQRIGNVSFKTFIKQSAIDCTAFFENKEMCKNLTEIMTSAGKCFRIPGIIQESDGFEYGARFVIKLPQHLYNPGVNQMLNDGIAVKLVESNRGIDHDLSFIPSGVHAIMPLAATRYEFINDPPRYKCEDNVDSTYSRVWCFEMCLTEKAELKCNCSLAASQAAVLSQARTPSICTTIQFFRCYAPEIFHENNTYDIERCKSQCKQPCTYWEYQKTISYAHFPSEQAKFFVESDEEFNKLKHTIILEVYYTNLDYTIIRHYYAMTLSGLLAQIGGQISLWIGGSIISLIQVAIYVFGAAYIFTKQKFFLKKENKENNESNITKKNDNEENILNLSKKI